MTTKDGDIPVPDRKQQPNSTHHTKSDSISRQGHATQAEVALNAISEILQRHKNNQRPQRSDSQTDSDDAKTVNTEISIDSNVQLITEVAAIVKGYQGEKEFPRSGIAGEDAEEDIKLEDGPAGPADLNIRVSNTDPDELNKLQLAQNTHPEIHTDDHVDTFDDFVNDMLAAAKRKKRRQRYNRVQVLLISWEDDLTETDQKAKELNRLIEEEVRTVHSLFDKALNFNVNRYAIPLVDSEGRDVNWERKVLLKVNGFIDLYDQPETLLILYYNGHGSFQQNSCYWHPTKAASERRTGYRRPDDLQFYGPYLEWNPIQNSISTKGDVLIILDCCYSGASLLDDHSKGRIPTTQILTACSKGQKTPAGPNSFTMNFVKAITDLLVTGKTKISITELYSVLVGTCTPQPFHVQRGPGNIVLERLLDPNAPEQDQFLSVYHPKSRGSSFSSAVDGRTIFSPSLKPEDAAITDTSSVSSNSSLLVTLVVRVREDVSLNAANWEHMLDALPPEEAAELASVKVQVEAAMPTNSTMLIISIPMEHWLLLPSNPAYTFLGFVKGHNMLLPPKSEHSVRDDSITLGPKERTDSSELKFHDGEADVIRQLIDAMLTFFQNIPSSSPTNLKSRKPGRFSHMATKIGFFPSSQKEPRSLENDPNFVTISQLMQKLIVVRNEKGEYEGLSYDLNFTVQRLFELTKKSVKESIRKVGHGGEEGVLEEAVTTEFDHLEKELLEKLKKEGIVKAPTSYSLAGSGSSKEKEKKDPAAARKLADVVVGRPKRDGEKSATAVGGEDEDEVPEDGPLTPRGSTHFNSRSSLLRHHHGLLNFKGDRSSTHSSSGRGNSLSLRTDSLDSKESTRDVKQREKEKIYGRDGKTVDRPSVPIRAVVSEKVVLATSPGSAFKPS